MTVNIQRESAQCTAILYKIYQQSKIYILCLKNK